MHGYNMMPCLPALLAEQGAFKSISCETLARLQEKLRRRVASVEVKVLNPPRPGKKCLVLDIDYTLFDLGSAAERPEELGRPYLHHFLKSAYEQYDIVIWSATSMKWIEVKMQQLGVLGNPDYKISFMLDHKAMITVQTERYGERKALTVPGFCCNLGCCADIAKGFA